ncbi:MAG: ABC transporter permease [Lentisphaeraceae bacterium]|nr:ABC transporter permease [Lentisphaeraceae bacterium]
MSKYVFKRLLSGFFTVFFIATVTFFGMHAIPGDPLSSDKVMSEASKEALNKKYGFDKPLYEQYFIFLKNTAQGDFGMSFTKKGQDVNDIIKQGFSESAKLGVLAILFAAFGGILWGALTAKYRNKWPDYLIMIFVILGISVPSFVFASFAQLFIVFLNQELNLVFPYRGDGSFVSLLVPALVLGLGTMAFLTRLMRSSLLEVINSDFVRTAKAKGLNSWQIFKSHELRNSILPVITILGPAIASITTGSFVIETIFTIPGLGKQFVEGVQQNDYTLIMGTTVFYGSFLVLMVLVVDIVYGFVDPRIKVGESK